MKRIRYFTLITCLCLLCVGCTNSQNAIIVSEAGGRVLGCAIGDVVGEALGPVIVDTTLTAYKSIISIAGMSILYYKEHEHWPNSKEQMFSVLQKLEGESFIEENLDFNPDNYNNMIFNVMEDGGLSIVFDYNNEGAIDIHEQNMVLAVPE